MSIEVKQKIKDVADDFAMPAKKLIEIVGKFYEKPKSSSQNLSEDQLNVIFDYITQQNQIDSIEQVFAAAAAKKETPAPAPAPAQQAKPAAPAQSTSWLGCCPRSLDRAVHRLREQGLVESQPQFLPNGAQGGNRYRATEVGKKHAETWRRLAGTV